MATNLQIKKLQAAVVLADNASESGEIERRLGAIVIYAGLADFLAIQAARLIEQIILKGQLADGGKPSFQPRPDTCFVRSAHIDARILKEIQRLLPFNAPNLKEADQAKRGTDLANQMIKT